MTPDDVETWRGAGSVPRLVGRLKRDDGGRIQADVRLRLYDVNDAFATVRGENKAIRITTDAMGQVFAAGCGQKPRATAVAALKDLEHILHASRRD